MVLPLMLLGKGLDPDAAAKTFLLLRLLFQPMNDRPLTVYPAVIIVQGAADRIGGTGGAAGELGSWERS